MLNYRFLFLVVFAAINVFWGTGSPLMDPDEPAYAETAKEMLRAGNYLSPRIFGDFWFDKPPMYYWLVIYSYKIFGVTEFAARFPAGLTAVLTVGSLYYYVRKFFNESIAFNAGIVLASCINFFYMGKGAVTDTTLLLFMSTALYAYLDEDYYFMYLCAALATLTKGPIGLVFPAAIAFFHMVITRNFKPLKDTRLYLGLLVYLVVTVPWYAMMYSEHGSAFIDTFLGLHNVGRFANPEHPGRVVWYFYIPVLILGLFPWINLFGNAIVSSMQVVRERSSLWFFHCWWIFVFIFFSVAQTKLVSYIFPMFPAVAVLIGWYLQKMDDVYNPPNKWVIIAQTVLFFGLFGAGMIFGARALPAVAMGTYTIAICSFLTMGLVAWSLYRHNIQAVIFTQAIFSLVIMFTLVQVVLPPITNSFSVKKLAINYKMHVSSSDKPLYVDKFLRPGFAFYTDEWGREIVDKRNAAFNTDAQNSFMITDLMDSPTLAGSNIVLRKSIYEKMSIQHKQRVSIVYDDVYMVILYVKK